MIERQAIEFACEACGEALSYPADKAGEVDVCPHCFEYLDIPVFDKPRRPMPTAASAVQADVCRLSFQQIDGLPRPEWETFCQFVFDAVPEPDWNESFLNAARAWLATLAAALPDRYATAESDGFLLLSVLPSAEARELLDFCEKTLAEILAQLDGIAVDEGYGKHVVLAFADAETYYTYISHFYSEGEYGGSGGMFVISRYQHIALHALRPEVHRTIAHELTHACLVHLPLPTWLNEGITQEIEDVVLARSSFEPTVELAKRQKCYWTEHTLEPFWSGDAFHAADDSQELAYALARVLVRNTLTDFRERFRQFALNASWNDAGQAACCQALGISLGRLAGRFLGEGAWDPQGGYTHANDSVT